MSCLKLFQVSQCKPDGNGILDGIPKKQAYKRPCQSTAWPRIVAERTGLEPATPCVTGRYSNRLNYRSALCSVGNEANITDCLTLRQRFFSSFESFAAKIAQVAIFSAFYRYLCPPEAASALLLHQIETGFMCCKLFICRKNNA